MPAEEAAEPEAAEQEMAVPEEAGEPEAGEPEVAPTFKRHHSTEYIYPTVNLLEEEDDLAH